MPGLPLWASRPLPITICVGMYERRILAVLTLDPHTASYSRLPASKPLTREKLIIGRQGNRRIPAGLTSVPKAASYSRLPISKPLTMEKLIIGDQGTRNTSPLFINLLSR